MANLEEKRKAHTIHDTEIVLNKKKLKEILDGRGMGYMELHIKIVDTYGLDLSYKGFMSLLSNRATWKLLYAHVIAETLKINYMEIFELISVDVNEVMEQKEVWKARYQND